MRLPIVCLLLLVSLPACTTWHLRGISLKELIVTEHPNVVRLTRADGSRVVVNQPLLVGSDSVAGFHNGVYSNLAVADVVHVEIRISSSSKTIALTAAIAAASAAAAYAVLPCDFWQNCGPDALSAQHVGDPTRD